MQSAVLIQQLCLSVCLCVMICYCAKITELITDHCCCCFCRANALWAAIVGQPRNSIIICRVQLGQVTSQLCQRTGVDDVRHHLWLSTGTQVRVGLSPSLLAGTAMTLGSAEDIQERQLSSREVKKTWLLDGGVDQYVGVDHRRRYPVLTPLTFYGHPR